VPRSHDCVRDVLEKRLKAKDNHVSGLQIRLHKQEDEIKHLRKVLKEIGTLASCKVPVEGIAIEAHLADLNVS